MTGYKFDNFLPEIGEETCVFKSLSDLKKFVTDMEYSQEADMRFWKIDGKFIRDEGNSDG